MKKKHIIIILGVLGLSALAYLAYKNFKDDDSGNGSNGGDDAFDNKGTPKKATDIWNPTEAPSGYGSLTPDTAKRKAQRINDAFGMNDDEDEIYDVFRSLKYTIQVKQVAYWYEKQYGVRLLADLQDRLSKSELNTVMGIVESIKI